MIEYQWIKPKNVITFRKKSLWQRFLDKLFRRK